MKLLGIGSKFDGSVVVRITSTDVVLDDGRHLTHTEVEQTLSK